ncbi:transcription regulator [Vibrio ishigakensis]|uniref:Transcription regulator n=2 Tax=Vibrio ishigakensis TaxID=1481914 RepID=A0A0B8P1J9_9VIBR|nr:transcription regulator [Vibrio ishigakensis]
MGMSIRLLLNGKKAGQEDVRAAVYSLREQGVDLEVRPTWEGGDIERLVLEAQAEGIKRIIAGGGDGTVNEVVSALLKHNLNHIELAVLPLGTANDFASACEIPTEPLAALELACKENPYWVDAGSANDSYFINIATAGFGAQVTATTPVALKNFLGGGAYTLSGLVQAINFEPFAGVVVADDQQKFANVVVGALCNGRTAGGGQPLAPDAYIDDGLLEAFTIEDFTAADIPKVIEDIKSNIDTQFVHRRSVKRVEWRSDVHMPINLDGEPLSASNVVIEVMPRAIKLVLPDNTPVLKHREIAS